MITPELAVLAIALLLSTMNISVYSWFENHEKHLKTGVWIIRMTAVFPALLVTLWAVYIMATEQSSTFAMALLTAGILLVGGAIQLLSLLARKQKWSQTSN